MTQYQGNARNHAYPMLTRGLAYVGHACNQMGGVRITRGVALSMTALLYLAVR